MKKLILIIMVISFASYGQRYPDLLMASKQQNTVSTTDYFENRAGAANPPSSTSITGWVSGSGTVSSSTEQARTGTTSLKQISNGGLDNNAFDLNSALNNDLPDFQVGDIVTFEGWVYASSGTDARVRLREGLATTAISYTPDTWSFWTFEVTIIEGAGNAIWLYTDDEVTGTYWDDIRAFKIN